jgi:hypothetical protein
MASTLHEWIEALPEEGRYVFARPDVDGVTDASAAAIKMTLYRLKKSGAIVAPRRDFFVVVPREYRAAGCPPASWFIDDLMRHMGRRYYVGLLTAAALHGAGHQQPMAFQVIVDSAERDIKVGRVRIDFHMSSAFDGAATQPMQTETGTMQVATPETTAFDLVRFPAAAGTGATSRPSSRSWRRSSTPTRSPLAPRAWPGRTCSASAGSSTSWSSRSSPTPSPPRSRASACCRPRSRGSARVGGAPLDPRWHVLVNDDVEPDL